MNIEDQESTEMSESIDEPALSKDRAEEQEPIHSIASAGNKLMYCLRDIKYCANLYVSISASGERERVEELKQRLERLRVLTEGDTPPENRGAIVKMLFDIFREVQIEASSYPTYALRSSLFLGVFSAFDAFIGELLTAIYTRKGDLLNKIGGSLELAKILQYQSFDDLKLHIVREEIENFRRDSYSGLH